LAEYRADLWRLCARVAALLPAAACASAGAPEFRFADTRNGDHPTTQAVNCKGGLIEATSPPIERMRKVE
jgi:hypothetical protein